MATTGRIGWAGATAAALGVNAAILALLSLDDRRVQLQRAPSTDPTLYLDIEPRATRPTDRLAATASHRSDGAGAPAPRLAPIPDHTSGEAIPSAPAAQAGAPVDNRWRVVPGVGPASVGLSSCDTPHLLSVDDRRRCDDRWARLGEDARAITGSGDAERDAAFARQGARRLAAWEAQRATPPRGDPPCENPHPMAGCEGVNIQIDLFSTRDGFLPNLRKRRE